MASGLVPVRFRYSESAVGSMGAGGGASSKGRKNIFSFGLHAIHISANDVFLNIYARRVRIGRA